MFFISLKPVFRSVFSLYALTALLLAAVPCNVKGQGVAGRIAGRIIDQEKHPVPFISVALLNEKDSTLVKAAVADEQGKYSFEGIPGGHYMIVSTGIGYRENVYKLPAYNGTESVQVPDISLLKSERMLKETVISGKKPLVQMKADRTILNVAGSINATGSNALELMRKAPGVRVSGDESITVNGKNGLMIYLDGKPTNLSGKDLMDFLKSIPSTSIQSIEIISNPSAKYDAAGNSGIIDIKTKKNANLGLNVSATINANFGSYNPKYDGSLSLNYRGRKYNVYGDYNYFNNNNRTRFNFLKKQSDNGEPITLDQQFINYTHARGHNYKAGVDFFLSPKSTIGVIMNGNNNKGDVFGDSKADISDAGSHGQRLISTNTQQQKNNWMNYNVNYHFTDTTGREFSMDGDYGTYTVRANSYQPNYYYQGGTETDRKIYNSYTSSDIEIASFKADYQQRLLGGNISVGAKFSSVKSDNGVSFFNVIDDVNQPDTGRTNQFVYREKIAAAYLMYNLKLKKWEMQAGVRGEHTAAEGTLTTLSKSLVQAVDTSYFNLFPSATVTYNFNDESSLGIAYSKRIDRPNYRSLNPFEFVLDELTYSKGNPFLRPQYTNTIKLSQNYRKLNVSVSYSNNKDYMMSFIDTIDGRKSYETRINMYYQKLYDLNIFYQLPVAKWWDADFNLYYYYEDIKGLAGKNILHRTQNSYSLSTNHTFRLPHKWTMELSAFYNSRSLWGAFIVDPQWTVDAGVQKKILKDAGIIKLSVSDIFNSLQLSNVRDFGGYYIKSDRTWETTQLRLSFSYKFGNLKLQGPRNRDTGVEEEERRAK
jgi:hypothetical protein